MHPLTQDPAMLVISGDWHGDLEHARAVVRYAAERGIEGVVQLGDFGVWHRNTQGNRFLDGVSRALTDAGIWCAFVDGNHENFDHLLSLPLDEHGTRPVRPNLWHLPRGLRWTWHGQTWLALGGAVSLDRHARREGVDWWAQETVTYGEARTVIDGGRADVMLTHDCPAGIDVPGIPPDSVWRVEALRNADAHRAQLRAVVDAVQPSRLFHGHFHSRYSTELQGEGYSCTVRGLDDNTGPFHRNVYVLT